MKTQETPPPLYTEAIAFITAAVAAKKWHQMISESDDIQAKYFAIIESPYNKYKSVMPLVVEHFTRQGWDCFFKSAYDARGPHNCFYINKKHFK